MPFWIHNGTHYKTLTTVPMMQVGDRREAPPNTWPPLGRFRAQQAGRSRING
jgi:hypothetical protein